jgi:upstream activation factor subunit UAF30
MKMAWRPARSLSRRARGDGYGYEEAGDGGAQEHREGRESGSPQEDHLPSSEEDTHRARQGRRQGCTAKAPSLSAYRHGFDVCSAGSLFCDEEHMAKRSTKKAAPKANSAFMKPVTPSAALSEVVGTKPIPRTEVTKRLWAYIKKNDLQDPKNKRNIKADATLKAVFGGKATVNMFEMTKLVGKHLK